VSGFFYFGTGVSVKEQILSVGIDIGTTTTQLVFSRLTLDSSASLMSIPQIEIVSKEVIYRGAIHFTPLKSVDEIDERKVQRLIEADYLAAGIAPDQVQTGAVIITGETARKKNAESVLQALSCFAGNFVVATAGATLEGVIAAKGANVDQESKKRGATILNLDIGGGTTNIAVFRNGEVIDFACLDIGGRLIRINSHGNIEYVSVQIDRLSRALDCHIVVGQPVNVASIERVVQRMAEILEEVLGIGSVSSDLGSLLTGHDLKRNYSIDYVSFTGGVADYINRNPITNDYLYGDIGIILGRAIANSRIPECLNILNSRETIRATVVGAGTHTTDVSGSTIAVVPGALPLQNVPVAKLSEEDEALPLSVWSDAIRTKAQSLRSNDPKENMALAFRGPSKLSFADAELLAEQIIAGMSTVLCSEKPLIVVIERDLAKGLGQILQRKLGPVKEVICIDSIRVENGDYIDIGQLLTDIGVVPVIVKTLIFN
jgi:ethanolamine utilization protein EutA